MGRRSRRRVDAPLPSPAPRAPSPPRADELPRPPWHPVPLIELCVLVGLVLVVLGFLNFQESSGRAMLVAGMALGSLGGLDTALREHLGGRRSHSTLLAALPAVLLAAALYFAGAPWPLLVLGAVAAFAAAFVALRRVFVRRSGGLSFKIR